MRKTLCASILVLAFCGSALAGDISNPSTPQPPPPPPPSTTTGRLATDGLIQTEAKDGFTKTLWSVLETALESLLALS